MQSRDVVPIQTLRISDREKENLIWAIHQSPSMGPEEPQDRLRVTATHTNAVLTLMDKTSQTADFAVVAYSHGRQGLSLIHGRYIHPNTRCRVRFRSLNGEWHERSGRTGQCIHVQGLIHALLVVFDEPINLDEFAQLTPEQETLHLREIAQESPHVEEEEEFAGLVSRVLYVDDQPTDRKLVSYWLNRSGMQVTAVGASEAACQQLRDSDFDLLLIDLRLGVESGVELIRTLRSDRCIQPILAVSADGNTQLHEQALNAGANLFMAKPLQEGELAANARRLMGVGDPANNAAIYSTKSHDPEMVPLLTGYVRSLAGVMQQLRDAGNKQDYETIERLASGLKGSGTSYGYPDITSAATTLLAALDDSTPDLDGIKRLTNALVAVLSRVKVKKTPGPEDLKTPA